MTCIQCAEVIRYVVPKAALSMCDGVVGAIADEHRQDRRDARIEASEGGAVVIRCPNCSGAVSVTGVSTIVDCQYCHVALRIPSTAFRSLKRDAPEPVLWWLLYRGPSHKRAQLLAGGASADDGDDHDVIPVDIEQAPEGRHGLAIHAASLLVPLAIFLAVGYWLFFDYISTWQP